MTATAHALVAGSIAAHFTDPATAILLALTSHYVMDSIPHWDFGTDWRTRPKAQTGALAILETLFGMTVAVWAFHGIVALPLLLATIVVSLLPDWLETPWYIFFARRDSKGVSKHAPLLEKLSYGFYKVPNVFHTKASMGFGLLTQAVTVGFFYILLK